MTLRAYKFRFYPTSEQTEMLAQTFGCVRFVYNYALNFANTQYQLGVKTKYQDWSAELTQLKKQSEFDWLKLVSSVPLQQALRHLDKAFSAFFKGISARPMFKSKRHKQSACFMANAFQWTPETKQFVLAKMKTPLNIKWSRDFSGTPSSAYISKTATGKYFISILVEETISPLKPVSKTVGIDLGLKNWLVCSDGVVVQNPKTLPRYEKKLAKAQRLFSRKRKGSNNHKKAKLKIALLHEKITNIRADLTHKTTFRLIQENQLICMETLRVKNMVKNPKLAKHILDANLGELNRQLAYKADWYGRTISKIDQWFPSSKLCSHCGALYEGKWSLAIREWRCSCGAVNDRDGNASINIETEGLRLYAETQRKAA